MYIIYILFDTLLFVFYKHYRYTYTERRVGNVFSAENIILRIIWDYRVSSIRRGESRIDNYILA